MRRCCFGSVRVWPARARPLRQEETNLRGSWASWGQSGSRAAKLTAPGSLHQARPLTGPAGPTASSAGTTEGAADPELTLIPLTCHSRVRVPGDPPHPTAGPAGPCCHFTDEAPNVQGPQLVVAELGFVPRLSKPIMSFSYATQLFLDGT